MTPRHREKIMKTMSLTEFGKRCLEVVDIVDATREPVVITKNGHPVAKLVPANRPTQDFLGCLTGTVEIVGDIGSPVQNVKDWKVLR
jgi:prevent-host-death family protein